jgi:nucleotide sugar dehydrogenase
VRAFYATVSDQVLVAADWRHAALVKIVENSLRYIDIVLTNQLAMAFPDMDVAEIMRLAASKWNVPEYHPSFGIGGYCIPIAPLYLMEQTKLGSHLSALREAVAWDEGYADMIAGRIASKRPGAVGILGVSYAPDTNIYHRSPALRVGRRLSERGVAVAAHDPFVSKEEAEETFGLPWLDYPHDLDRFSLLLLGASHAAYRDLPAILSRLDSPPAVVDNLGEMRECFAGLSLRYSEMGAPGVFLSEHA